MKPLSGIFYLILLIFVCSFTSGPNFCRKSGIKGHIFRVSGNKMPSPDQPASAPAGYQTTLYIFELTNINQVNREGISAFYKEIQTKLVKEVTSDEQGAFKVKLKPGWYSLFVKKGDLFYSSQFDEKNNIHPVEVKAKSMTEVSFSVNYDATY